MVGLHTAIPPLRVLSLISLLSALGMVVQRNPCHTATPPHSALEKKVLLGNWDLVGLYTAIPPLRVMSLISLLSPLGMVVQSKPCHTATPPHSVLEKIFY